MSQLRPRERWLVLAAIFVAFAAAGALIGKLTGGRTQLSPVATLRQHSPATQTPISHRAPRSGLPARHPDSTWTDAVSLRRRVAEIAASTGAGVGVALRPLGSGSTITEGALQAGAAWSTMKIPVVLARYRLAESRGESDASVSAQAATAITASDNAAAQALFDGISRAEGGLVGASRYVQQELQAAGDGSTVVNTIPSPQGFSTFGQTSWSLPEGTRFFRALADGCLAPRAAAKHVLSLMGQVITDQRWGLGSASFRGAGQVLLKGGWGPDSAGRYLVRQFGVVETSDGHGFTVGLMARPSDGTFQGGIAVLNQLAAAVAITTTPRQTPAVTSC